MAGFNDKHPEMRHDEVFLCNIATNEEPDEKLIGSIFVPDEEEWNSIGWVTKRMGEVAYTTDGKKIRDMRPIFVKRAELHPEVVGFSTL